jgi:hypothetical protein
MIESLGQWGAPLLSFVSALLGGLVAHYLSMYRDRASKRRELGLKSKMELWKLIDGQNTGAAMAMGRDEPNISEWEGIVRDIQLLGTSEQIEQVLNIVKGMNEQKDVSFNPLLNSIQKEIRKELGMSPATTQYFWFRGQKKAGTIAGKTT